MLTSKVWFPISVRIVAPKAFQDKPNSRCKKSKNSSLMSPSLSTDLKTKDSCSWFEQSDASSAKNKKNLSFMSLILYELTTTIN